MKYETPYDRPTRKAAETATAEMGETEKGGGEEEMSDYELLKAMWSEYEAELERRKKGEIIESVYLGEKKSYKTLPANKERTRRLRLEIQAIMRRIESKMTLYSGDEEWY